MLDIRLVRSNPDLVKENIKKKFQDEKLVLVDEVLELDKQFRDAKSRGDYLRGQRNTLSKQIGGLMAKGQKEEAEQVKAQVTAMAQELEELEVKEGEQDFSCLKALYSRADVFGVDLYAVGLGEKIEGMVKELYAGNGAVRKTLHKYTLAR